MLKDWPSPSWKNNKEGFIFSNEIISGLILLAKSLTALFISSSSLYFPIKDLCVSSCFFSKLVKAPSVKWFVNLIKLSTIKVLIGCIFSLLTFNCLALR